MSCLIQWAYLGVHNFAGAGTGILSGVSWPCIAFKVLFPKIAGPDLFPGSSCVAWYAMVCYGGQMMANACVAGCLDDISYKCPRSTSRNLYAHWKGSLSLFRWKSTDIMTLIFTTTMIWCVTQTLLQVFVFWLFLWILRICYLCWWRLSRCDTVAEDVSSSRCYSQSELLLGGEFVTRPASIWDEANWLVWRAWNHQTDYETMAIYGLLFHVKNGGMINSSVLVPIRNWDNPQWLRQDSQGVAVTTSAQRDAEAPDALAGKQKCTSDQFPYGAADSWKFMAHMDMLDDSEMLMKPILRSGILSML